MVLYVKWVIESIPNGFRIKKYLEMAQNCNSRDFATVKYDVIFHHQVSPKIFFRRNSRNQSQKLSLISDFIFQILIDRKNMFTCNYLKIIKKFDKQIPRKYFRVEKFARAKSIPVICRIIDEFVVYRFGSFPLKSYLFIF